MADESFSLLIAGVGRSGTTTLFEVLGRSCLKRWKHCECVYEPYLWNLPEVRKTATAKGAPFSNENINHFGLNVHTNVPLFLQTESPLHSEWMRQIFGPPDAAESQRVVKEIRAMGRLSAMLSNRKNLKCILVLRNPLEIINSSLGMFSFFGEEFHASDRPRFKAELTAKHSSRVIEWPPPEDIVGWSDLWVRHFFEAGIATQKKFGARVFVIPYESYVADKTAMLLRVRPFLGLEEIESDSTIIDRPAGPTTSERNLSIRDIDRLVPSIERYALQCQEFDTAGVFKRTFVDNLVDKFKSRPQGKGVLFRGRLSRTAVQWRAEAVKLEIEKNNLSEALARVGGVKSSSEEQRHFHRRFIRERLRNTASESGIKTPAKNRPTVGCIVTTFNNQNTILDCLDSIQNQTRRVDVIFVCDDGSTDDTVKLVRAVAERDDRISITVRRANVGPSANRDFAIRKLGTDIFTQIDGDDEFAPTKIELELNALQNLEEDVAYSDIELVTKSGSVLQDTSGLDGCDARAALSIIVARSTPVPRDMLMARSLYMKTGGYDFSMSLYEDWAFKLRLCSVMNGRWRYAKGDVGTIYNRIQPGLSNRTPIAHVYWQLHALGTVIEHCDLTHKNVLDSINIVLKPLLGKMKGMPELLLQSLVTPDKAARFRRLLSELVVSKRFGGGDSELNQALWMLLKKSLECVEDPEESLRLGNLAQEKRDSGIAVADVRLDEYIRGDGYTILDLSLLSATSGQETWKHVKFKFCLTREGRVLEFRQGTGWPTAFQEWPSVEKDAYGSVLRLRDKSELPERIARWRSVRDQRLLELIATLLPVITQTALSQKKGDVASLEELNAWGSEAKIMSDRVLAVLSEARRKASTTGAAAV